METVCHEIPNRQVKVSFALLRVKCLCNRVRITKQQLKQLQSVQVFIIIASVMHMRSPNLGDFAKNRRQQNFHLLLRWESRVISVDSANSRVKSEQPLVQDVNFIEIIPDMKAEEASF